MSVWTEVRDGIRQAVVTQERVERSMADVQRITDRLVIHDRRLTRVETLIEMARPKLLPR